MAFDDFRTALGGATDRGFVGLLIDSEDPVVGIEKTWEHLRARDGWERPAGASDEQVLLITTCMETWILADREGLRSHYKGLQESALPALENLESRRRQDVLRSLEHATRDCSNACAKGKRSFEVIAVLSPEALQALPSFARGMRILNARL